MQPSLVLLLLNVTFALAHAAAQTIPLPLGFSPEGITKGKGNRLFVGNVRNGAIYRLNIRTNVSRIIVKPFEDRIAVGLAVKNNKLFVAGGGQFPFGSGTSSSFYVYNTASGKQIAACNITRARFFNDVTTRFNKAYFSDSASDKVFVVPIKTVRMCKFTTIKLPEVFKPNGDGLPRGNGIGFFKGQLLVANSAVGTIYAIDPKGRKRSTPLMPPNSVRPDGIIIKNRKLYIVENSAGLVRVWRLRKNPKTGKIEAKKLRSIRSDTFSSPSTAVIIKGKLYVANSRFAELDFGADLSREKFTLSVVPAKC